MPNDLSFEFDTESDDPWALAQEFHKPHQRLITPQVTRRTLFTLGSSLFISKANGQERAAQSTGTLEIQVNPITMKSLGKISGLNISEAGLWNCVGRNNSASTVTIDLEDVQLAFPQVNFLNSFESNLLLSQKAKESIWKVLLDLSGDAVLGASVFVSPWFLLTQPIQDKLRGQLEARVPNVAGLIAKLQEASFTVAPSQKFSLIMLAGLMDRADVHFYKKVMAVEVQPATPPPARMREMGGSVSQPKRMETQPVPACPPAPVPGISFQPTAQHVNHGWSETKDPTAFDASVVLPWVGLQPGL
jgi:hypothetical protein